MVFRCPACNQTFELASPGGERQVNCPHCGQSVDRGKLETLRYDETPAHAGGTPPPAAPAGVPAAPADAAAPMSMSPGIFDSAVRTHDFLTQDLTLEPGMSVGPYRVIELIGRGGMGAVYKALQPNLDRVVALKVLPCSLAKDPDFVARFNREAKTLANLNHPNIVAIYDMGVAAGVYYFVMEFVDGVTLRQVLRERKLSAGEALRIVPQLCEALEYAHSEGVVHRDIKPENLLLDRKGRVRIADFGLARIVRGEQAPGGVTRTNMVMGTLEYMAPEQRESPKNVDHRADIYSLGVVLYEMLTGELPVGRWDPPSRRADIDVRVDEVVAKSLERDPARRYQRASHLGTDIHELSPGAAAAAQPASQDAMPALASWVARYLGSDGFRALGPLALPRLRVEAVFAKVEVPFGATVPGGERSHYVVLAGWPADRRLDPVNLRTLLQEGCEGIARQWHPAGSGAAPVVTLVVAANEPLPREVEADPAGNLSGRLAGALVVDLFGGRVAQVPGTVGEGPEARVFLDNLERCVKWFAAEWPRGGARVPTPTPGIRAATPLPAAAGVPVPSLAPPPPLPPAPPAVPLLDTTLADPAAARAAVALAAPVLAPDALKTRWFGFISFALPSALLFLMEGETERGSFTVFLGLILGAVAFLKGRKALRVLRRGYLAGIEETLIGMGLGLFFPILWLLERVSRLPDQTLWAREAGAVALLLWGGVMWHLLARRLLSRCPITGRLRAGGGAALWALVLVAALAIPTTVSLLDTGLAEIVGPWSRHFLLLPWFLCTLPFTFAYWFFVVKGRSARDLLDLLAASEKPAPCPLASPAGATATVAARPGAGPQPLVAAAQAAAQAACAGAQAIAQRAQAGAVAAVQCATAGSAPVAVAVAGMPAAALPLPPHLDRHSAYYAPHRALLSFLWDAGAYAIIVGFLIFVNFATSDRHLWFIWPAAAWGLGLAFHFTSLVGTLFRARLERLPGDPPFRWHGGTRRPIALPEVREALIGLGSHAASYAIVIGFLAFLNYATSDRTLWFLWPAAGWGIGLAFHVYDLIMKVAEVRLLPAGTNAPAQGGGVKVEVTLGRRDGPPPVPPLPPVPPAAFGAYPAAPVSPAPPLPPAPPAAPEQHLSFFSVMGCLSLVVGLPLAAGLLGIGLVWVGANLPAFRDHVTVARPELLQGVIAASAASFVLALWLLSVYRLGRGSFSAYPGRLWGWFPIRWSGRLGWVLLVGSLGLGASLVRVPEARAALESLLNGSVRIRRSGSTLTLESARAFSEAEARVNRRDYQGARPAYEKALAAVDAELASLPEFVRRARVTAPDHRTTLARAHYNLACIEALASVGQDGPDTARRPVTSEQAAHARDLAFAHLRTAIQQGYQDADHLAEDSDLAPLHADARWDAVVSELTPAER